MNDGQERARITQEAPPAVREIETVQPGRHTQEEIWSAVNAAEDSGQVTYLTTGGRRTAAIVPAALAHRLAGEYRDLARTALSEHGKHNRSHRRFIVARLRARWLTLREVTGRLGVSAATVLRDLRG